MNQGGEHDDFAAILVFNSAVIAAELRQSNTLTLFMRGVPAGSARINCNARVTYKKRR